MTKLVQALALLANATSMCPPDRRKFDSLLEEMAGEPEAATEVAAMPAVDVQPSTALSERRRKPAPATVDKPADKPAKTPRKKAKKAP